MDVFVYKAALYCAPCGEKIREDLTNARKAPADPSDEHTFDSDTFPKGPYPNGGGEGDSPSHCDACAVFLENPLTTYGHAYVVEQVADTIALVLQGKRETIRSDTALGTWISFYGIEVKVGGKDDEPSTLGPRDLVENGGE